MPDAISLGTIYATVRLAMEQLQADVKAAMVQFDEVKAQADAALSGALGGQGSRAVTAVRTEAESAAAAITEVGAAGTRAGAEAAAGAEKAAVGLRGAGAAAKEGAGGVGSFIGKVAGIAGAIGTVELAAQGFEFLRDRVSEALQAGMEANQVAAQTVAGLKSTHDASGQTADSIDALATKTMQLTGIDDDSVHSAENMLLTFTNIGKNVFPQATQAVADLATKMAGGATPSAIQMQQASIQLGKALGDPLKGYTALQRVGVTFTEQQKEQIKSFMASGNVAGAQTVILKEMNKEFGGSAVAAGQANGGIAILRAEMANTTQTIGQALIPALNQVTGAFAPLLQWAGHAIPDALKFLSQHADEAKALLAGLGIAVTTVVLPALGAFIPVAWAAVAPILAGALPVLALGAALAGLALLFKHAMDTSEPFRHAVEGLVEQVKGLAGLIVGNLQDAFTRILPYLQQAATWVGDHLEQAFRALLPHVTDFVTWLSQASDVIAAQVEPVVSALTTALIGLFQWLQTTGIPALQAFAGWLSEHLGPVFQQVAGWVQHDLLPGLERLGDWLTGTAQPAVGGFASALGTRLGPILQQVGGWLQTTVLPALQQFGSFLQTQVFPAVQQAATALRQFGDDLSTRLGPALENIGRFVSAFAGILMTVLKPVAEVVFGALVVAFKGLQLLWQAAWPEMRDTLLAVWGIIQGAVKVAWSIISGIIKVGLDVLGGNWKQAWTDLKDMLSGVWAGIQQILSSALGGVVNLFLDNIQNILQALAHLPGPAGDMARQTLASIEQLRSGSSAKTQQMAADATAHAAAMKVGVLTATASMHAQAAAHFDLMRQEILQQLANTTDPAKRHALELKLAQVTAAEQAEQEVSQHYEQLAHNVAAQTVTMRDQSSQHAKETRDGVVGPFGGLSATVGGLFATMGATVHQKLADLQQTAQTAWQNVVTTVGQKLADLQQTVHDKVQPIIDAVSGPFTWLKGFISGVWDFISGVFRVVGDILWALVKLAWDKISAIITTALTALKQWLSDRWDEISARVGAVWQTIHDALKAWWDKITSVVQTALAPLERWLSDHWDAIHTKITSVWTVIHDDVASVWDKITTTIQNKANALRNAVLKPFNDAKDAIGGVVKGFGNAAIKELNSVIQGWADLGNDLGNVINTVAKAVGVSDRVPTLKLPSIPALARGTAHHAGGLAIVGEEGPELVNLPKGASVLPAGPTASLLSGLSGWGVPGIPGYAGGVGDFFSALGSKVSGAIGDLNAMLQEGPSGIVQKALAALGLDPSQEPGLFGSLGGGALAKLRAEVQSYVATLLGKVSNTALGGAVSASYGSAPGLLPGFPLMNQLAQRDVNDLNDCVPTSLASAASFLLKRLVSPVGIKDDVYGSGYVGGQSPDRYRAEMGKLGVALQAAYGTGQALISTIIAHLRAGQPVVGSIPSNWNVISQGGPTHEVAFAGYDAGKGLLTAMNPWKGFFQTASPSWWAPRLQYGAVNPLVKLAGGGVLREVVAGVGMSSGRSYLMGEGGPGTEAVVPLSKLGNGGDTYNITVEVVAAAEDGAPYPAGVAFGNGFAAGFQQARTQRGQ